MRNLFLIFALGTAVHGFSQEKQAPLSFGLPKLDSVLNIQPSAILSKLTGALPKPGNIDSSLEAQFQQASASIIDKIKSTITSSLKNIQKKDGLLPGMPKIESSKLAALKKFNIGDAVFSSEVNEWESATGKNIFSQNNISANVNAAGVPVSTSVLDTRNFFENGNNKRFTYKINYNRKAFLDKLGVDKTDLKSKMKSALNFGEQINYKDIVSKSFSGMPAVNNVISATGCNWNHLLEMPMSEFQKIYNKDALKQKLADAEKLERYYVDHAKDKKDAFIAGKVQQADSQLVKLKFQTELYEKLIAIKKQADKLKQKILELKKLYDEKVKIALDAYNVVNDVIQNNNDLSGFQKFMLKVKGVSIGQHTISTGNLALQNFLQYGVSFEYETDRSYLLLTKGSQEKLEAPGNYFQQTSTQGGINEYYQFNSKYRLTGVSVGRGKRTGNFYQVSMMNFNKTDKFPQPSLFAKNVNVFTMSQQYTTVAGQKLFIDLSKSVVKQQNSGIDAANSPDANIMQTLAARVKYDYANPLTQDMHKLSFFYCSDGYNNPGLNGGISRPGVQFDYGMNKKINSRFRIDNQFAYYGFKYGDNVSLRSVRDKVNITYKLKKMSVGLMFNGSHQKQLQYDPKVISKTNSMDVLATGQTRKRFGNFFVNVNGGLGYGFSKQELFSEIKNWSFYANSNISYKGFALDIDADRFNTRNTEIFSTDSTTLILNASFNLQSMLSYTDKKGNFMQAGLLYNILDNNARQIYISGSAEWRLFKKITIGTTLSLPVSSPTTAVFMNNTFNSKLIYNINGHDK